LSTKHAKDTEEQVSLTWFIMQWTQHTEIHHQTVTVILDFITLEEVYPSISITCKWLY